MNEIAETTVKEGAAKGTETSEGGKNTSSGCAAIGQPTLHPGAAASVLLKDYPSRTTPARFGSFTERFGWEIEYSPVKRYESQSLLISCADSTG